VSSGRASGRVVAVGLGQPVGELMRLDHVLLGADRLQHQGGEQAADLGRPLLGQASGAPGQETGPGAVPHPSQVHLGRS
jgi:hypothetical protein